MAEIDVVDLGGNKVGSLELAEEVFSPSQINQALLWEAVKHHRASLRQGTHATKTRGLVSGSGKKLWKQKGTGRARIASIRSPLWRHGGTVHGPKPRSYEHAFPRKKLKGALRSALASRFQDGKLVVVESFELPEAKTKAYRAALDKLDARRTALLVEGGSEVGRSVELGSRNLPGISLMLSREVHPYDLLSNERVIFSRKALEQLQGTLAKSASKSASKPRSKAGATSGEEKAPRDGKVA